MLRTSLLAIALLGCSKSGPASPTPPSEDPTPAPAAQADASPPVAQPPPAPMFRCGGRRVIAFVQYGRAHVTQVDIRLVCEDGGPRLIDDSNAVHRTITGDAFDAAWKRIDESAPWRTLKYGCDGPEGLASMTLELSDGSTTRRFECTDVEEAPAVLVPLFAAVEAVAKELGAE